MIPAQTLKRLLACIVLFLCTQSIGAQMNDLSTNPLNQQIAEIDVLFVYAKSANESHDGGAENWINRLVELTNQAMIDSHVYIRINNVGMQAVEYPANVNFTTALVDIQSGVHESLINIDNLRYELGADVVSFVVASDNSCGEAFGNSQIAGKAHQMYHVIGIGCLDSIFAHELGHNLGLGHSRRQEAGQGHTFDYALGHGINSSFATIMTYSHFFNASLETVMQYSNSENSCNGYPCGVGREKEGEGADAAYALNQIRFQAQDLYHRSPLMVSGGEALNNIRDNELQQCIDEHLAMRNIAYAGALHELECIDRGITSLSGIEGFPNITRLNLSGNNLRALSSLSSLFSLSELYISNTGIQDISVLSRLTHLGILAIADNDISDITALSELRYLHDLDLNNNQIANIAPLANAEIRWQFVNVAANTNLYCWQKSYFTNRYTNNVFFSDDACDPSDDDNDFDNDGISNINEINNGGNPFISAIADGHLVFSKPVFRINEGDQQVVLSVKRTSGSQPISATLFATSDSGSVDHDVFIATQEIQLAGNQNTLELVADIDDDAQLEFVERVIVTLQQNDAEESYASIVIDDNEQSLQWTEIDVQVNEADENATLTLELLNSTDQAASVAFTIKPITAFFGNGNDYLLERGVIDVAANQTLATLNIPLFQDNFEEPTETFMITLIAPVNANLGEQTVVIVTINDDDAPTQPTLPAPTPTKPDDSSGGALSSLFLLLLCVGLACKSLSKRRRVRLVAS